MFGQRLIWWLLAVLAMAAFALSTARPSRGAGEERRHVVRAGETVWTIATRAYPGDPREAVWRIEQRNGLTGRPLLPGTVIFLPS
jgi:hypothetical protein